MNIQRIGKYRIFEDNEKFQIKYIYTLSDFIGSIWYILSILLGVFFSFISLLNFKTVRFSWFVFLVSIYFLVFGIYNIVLGLYNPKNGVFQIDKRKKEIKIVDVFKIEIINIDFVSYATFKVYTDIEPITKYAIISLKLFELYGGDLIDCFIVRSKIPIDIRQHVNRNLEEVSNKLKSEINIVLEKIKND